MIYKIYVEGDIICKNSTHPESNANKIMKKIKGPPRQKTKPTDLQCANGSGIYRSSLVEECKGILEAKPGHTSYLLHVYLSLDYFLSHVVKAGTRKDEAILFFIFFKRCIGLKGSESEGGG